MQTNNVNYMIKFTQEYNVNKMEYSSVSYKPQYVPPTIAFYPTPRVLDHVGLSITLKDHLFYIPTFRNA